MVHELDPLRLGVAGDLRGRADAADASGVDLDEADPAMVDQVAGDVGVVGTLAGSEPHGARPACEPSA